MNTNEITTCSIQKRRAHILMTLEVAPEDGIVNMPEVLDELIIPSLRAHGFLDSTIAEYINTDLIEAKINEGFLAELPTSLKPGQNYPGKGIHAGILRGDDGNYYNIFFADERGEFESEKWGCCGDEINCADSLWDGMANTKAMAQAGSDIAKKVLDLEIDGNKDFYIPSPKEGKLGFINAQDAFKKELYWTSRQYSADYAYSQGFEGGTQCIGPKGGSDRVRAVRRVLVIE